MERGFKIFVVNAPFWFAMPWNAVAPLLSANTRAKVTILGAGQLDALYGLDHRSGGAGSSATPSPLDRRRMPERYGGTQGSDGGRLEDSPEERALRWLVDEANAK